MQSSNYLFIVKAIKNMIEKEKLPILSSKNINQWNNFMLDVFGEVWTYAPKDSLKSSQDIVEGMDFILKDNGEVMTSIKIENPIDKIFDI